ncbi:MAG: hypothetical protein LR015_14595 [Verrucomicrobia bacterium]|nr:hypothetical protein [Verrucomicrobiota bacterium]
MVRVEVDSASRIQCQILPYRLDTKGVHLLQEEQRRWFLQQLAGVSGDHLAPDSIRSWWNAAIDAIPVAAWYSSCTGMDYTFERMRQNDPIGLARLRTRLSSPSHYEFMIDGINRLLSGQHGQSPSWMLERIHQWTDAGVLYC